MALIVQDEEVSQALIAERQANGCDRYDEVWDGVYIIVPLANNPHQDLVMAFSGSLMLVWDMQGLGRTQPGANVSDREDDWRKNYRIPDVLCFTKDSPAVDRYSHWLGGPEFAIEIASPGEKPLAKLDFYAGAGTQELLIVERVPWRMSLYRVEQKSVGESATTMSCVGTSGGDNPQWLKSQVVPAQFLLDLQSNKICIADDNGKLLREMAIQGD